jgi:uncharacterized protein (DUF58 family)
MRSFPLLDPVSLTQLPPLALKALRIVEGTLTGLHQSPHQGQSIEFAQHKEYTPGDDIRHIDWRLFGKSDRYYIKQFEDETNLKSYLLLDASGSMAYPEKSTEERPSKYEVGAMLALSLAYLLFRQGDAVGMFTFNQTLSNLMPPKNRPSYLHPLAATLSDIVPQGDTALLPALKQMAELMRRRSLVVLLSDLFVEPESIGPMLRQFTSQGHDVILFHLLDPDELGFPFRDQTLFEDLEDPQQQLQIDAHAIRPYYLEELQRYLDEVEQLAFRSGIEYWRVDTSQSTTDLLRRFLLRRNSLRQRR